MYSIDRTGTEVQNVAASGMSPTGSAAANTAAFNAAAVIAASVSSSPYIRKTLYVPPGNYSVDPGMVVPVGVNLDMRGANFTYADVATSQPILTIGDTSSNNSGGSFIGIKVACTSGSSHKYPDSASATFAAVRVINANYCDIEVSRLAGTYVGLQMYGAGSSSRSTQYNNVRIGTIFDTKVGIDCRTDATGAWCNENHFWGGNYAPSSAMKNFGSCYGIRFSREPGGYSSQNHNKFSMPCFQLGNANSSWILIWSAGISITAGWRVYSGGREYLATTSGTTGGSQPVHDDGSTQSDGGVSWTDLGNYRRSPLLFDDAGSRCIVRDARWELGIGPVAVMKGTGWSDRNEFHFDYFSNDMGNATRLIEDVDYAATVQVPLRSRLFMFGWNPQPEVAVDNWEKRAIGSASGWCIPGVHWITRTAHHLETYGVGDVILCSKGVNTSTAAEQPCIIVDVRKFKRFEVWRDSRDDLGRMNFAALDANFARIDLGTQASPVTPFPIAGNSAQIISTYDYIQTGFDSDNSVIVSAGSGTSYVAIWPSDCTLSSLRVRGIEENGLTLGTMRLASPFGDPGKSQRASIGTPTIGRFHEQGEVIGNLEATSGQPPYYVVTVPGALAPAWSAGATVLLGELRTSSGYVYEALDAGVTGATPPSHTVGSASDDNLDWQYISDEATVTAATVLS